MSEFEAAAAVGTAVVIVVAVVTGGVGGLIATGFTPSGVAAGSAAAAWQSTIGNVAAGTLFATFQAAGASIPFFR